MTNKTITLSRELVERIIDAYAPHDNNSHCHLNCDGEALDELRAALAAPVPPAGGEPVYEAQWNSIHGPEGWKSVGAEEYARCDGPLWDRRITHEKVNTPTVRIFSGPDTHFCWTPDNTPKDKRKILVLVEHNELMGLEAHVTRLQAEVERLKSMSSDPFDRMRDLQSELTKLGDDYCKRVDELTKARELLTFVVNSGGFSYKTVVKEIREFLSNQSAPADKGQGEPVVWVQGFPKTGHFPAKLQEDRKNGYTIPLYAEQPAPAAVVMPGRKTVKAGLLSESNTHNQGWNACLDEVGRLNPEPKP